LSFQGGLTVADTHFTPADLAALTANGQQYLGTGTSRISLAPLYSGALSGTYKLSVSDRYQLRFNIGAKFTSAYNTGSDLDPRKTQAAFALANGRVAFGPDDKRWSFEIWSENLFDKRYEQVAFDAPFQNAPTNSTGVIDAFLGAPRTFGMTVRAKY
jgi:outer membrane receptor protein involved in Fe transport